MNKQPGPRLNDLVGERVGRPCITIPRVAVWRFRRGLGLTPKKKTCKVRHWFEPNGERAKAACGPRCPPGDRRRDEPRAVRALWRDPTGADLAARRRDRSRQSVTAKSRRAAKVMKAAGAGFLFLPPCSPDPCVAKNNPQTVFLSLLTNRNQSGIHPDHWRFCPHIRQAQGPHPQGSGADIR